ncbi:hypothetical protein ANAPC5_01262 [Anaplasma phagocytophilum]|nr:hypothetical protein ANAPC5_01262 [Anaplasma phagocytophilum]
MAAEIPKRAREGFSGRVIRLAPQQYECNHGLRNPEALGGLGGYGVIALTPSLAARWRCPPSHHRATGRQARWHRGWVGWGEMGIPDKTKQRYAPLQRERRAEKRLARCQGIATSLSTPSPFGSVLLRRETASSQSRTGRLPWRRPAARR